MARLLDGIIGAVGVLQCIWLLGCFLLFVSFSTYEDPENPDAFPTALLVLTLIFFVLFAIESWALWQIAFRHAEQGYIALGAANVILFSVGILDLVFSDEPLDGLLFLITISAGLVSCLCLAGAIRERA